jgi:uncharacterized protein (DUF433 family)
LGQGPVHTGQDCGRGDGGGRKGLIYLKLHRTEVPMTTANLLERITSDPDVCGGRPCVRGMRIRASDILEMLGLGVSQADILKDFPDLVEDDIKACLLLAARRLDVPRVAA